MHYQNILKNITTITSATLILMACGDNKSQDTTKNNKSKNKIYIKDLTTGVKFDNKNFPRMITSDHFKYSYFGKSRLIEVKLNEDKIVTSYKIILSGDLYDIKEAIEKKISLENKEQVEFQCKKENWNGGGVDWEKKVCSITSDQQTLTLNENKPITNKPSFIDESTWQSMHTSSIVLEEKIELSKESSEAKKENLIQREIILKNSISNAKSDI